MANEVNILILDDEETLLISYSSIFKNKFSFHFSLITISDGDDVLRILRESNGI